MAADQHMSTAFRRTRERGAARAASLLVSRTRRAAAHADVESPGRRCYRPCCTWPDGSVDCADDDGRVMARFRGIEYADTTSEAIDAARLRIVAREALGRSVALDSDLFELGVSSLNVYDLDAVGVTRRVPAAQTVLLGDGDDDDDDR